MFDTATRKLSRLKNKFFSGIFYLVGILLVLTCAGIICYQSFIYLYQGGWVSLPLRSLLKYTPYQFYSWVLDPTAWLGLHKVVYWTLNIPLSFSCFFIGYLFIKISDFMALFSDDWSIKNKMHRKVFLIITLPGLLTGSIVMPAFGQ